MASSEYLSQDEIDALLASVDNSGLELHTASAEDCDVCVFEFSHQTRLDHDSLQLLEMVNERFARQFTRNLFGLLRNKVEISVTGVQTVEFSEYLHSQPVPTSINLLRIEPIHDHALCVFEPELVFHVVDAYYGGASHFSGYNGRDFSPSEIRLTQRLLQVLVEDLIWSWQPVVPLEISVRDMEADPYFAQMLWPDDRALVCAFHAGFEGHGGNFSIVLPQHLFRQLDKLKDNGKSQNLPERDDQWADAIREELKTAQLTLNCQLSQTEMRLSDLLRLKIGDIVPIESVDSIIVSAEDVPLYQGEYAIHKGQKAVKIEDYIAHPDSAPDAEDKPASDKE